MTARAKDPELNAQYMRQWRSKPENRERTRAYRTARERALAVLAAAHEAEYVRYYDIALADVKRERGIA